MLNSQVAELKLLGYYSQIYNSIIQSGQVWRVSKYFLRRWGPYLGPTRFWAIVTARQLCYRNQHQDWFEGYDAAVAQEIQISRAHYRRLKAEMDDQNGLLSLFISRQATSYHVVNGKTRPKPTLYHVRLDDPLTPADAAYLAGWLRQQQVKRRTNDVVRLLHSAREISRQELLDPHPAPTSTSGLQPVTVLQVVRQVFGGHIADQPEIIKASEALHAYLTDIDFVGKQYFRHRWLKHLKAGPAFLLIYLRSLCYYNEQSGELRNQIIVDRQQLAQTLAVKPNTISDWLKTLATIAPQQTLPPFLTLQEKGRTAENTYVFTYQVGMLDPLTPDDLPRYDAAISAHDPSPPHPVTVTERGQSENERHKKEESPPSQSENDIHKDAPFPYSQSDFERHETTNYHPQSENERLTTPSRSEYEHHNGSKAAGRSENERHDQGQDANLSTTQRKNDRGSIPECAPFKYFPILLSLQQDEINTWLTAAGWPFSLEMLRQSLVNAISQDNFDGFLDFLGIDPGGPARQRIKASGLSAAEGTAWWLYALTQPGLQRPMHFVIARMSAGVPPPRPFVDLANLSVEGWLTFALNDQLPEVLRLEWGSDPVYAHWSEIYGSGSELPPLVMEWMEVLDEPLYKHRIRVVGSRDLTTAADTHPVEEWWTAVCETLQQQMPASIYEIFVRPIQCSQSGGVVSLWVPDQTAQTYLEQALRPQIEEALAQTAGRSLELEFHIRAVGEGLPAGVDETARYGSIWQEVKEALSLQMARSTYDQWLHRSELIEGKPGELIVAVETAYAREWLENRLRPLIEKTLRLIAADEDFKITFVVS